MNFIKEPCDIILLAGQSNAVGCGRGDVTEAIEDNPDVLLFYDTQVEGYEKDENGKDVLTVKEPFVYDIKIMSEKNAEGNIAFSFANEYVKEGRLQAGRKLLIVRAAVGGTGFFKREWTKDGILFKRMLEMLEKTLAMNPENRLVALCWHQGESDAFERQDLIDTERKERYPIAWQALLKLANMKEQVVNTTKATSDTLAQFVYDNSQNLKISVSVCNGYSLSFDPQLSDILNKISSREMETFFVDSSKMLTRNFEKYLHVLEIILGNNGVFCTCNYYISNTCLEKEDAF